MAFYIFCPLTTMLPKSLYSVHPSLARVGLLTSPEAPQYDPYAPVEALFAGVKGDRINHRIPIEDTADVIKRGFSGYGLRINSMPRSRMPGGGHRADSRWLPHRVAARVACRDTSPEPILFLRIAHDSIAV